MEVALDHSGGDDYSSHQGTLTGSSGGRGGMLCTPPKKKKRLVAACYDSPLHKSALPKADDSCLKPARGPPATHPSETKAAVSAISTTCAGRAPICESSSADLSVGSQVSITTDARGHVAILVTSRKLPWLFIGLKTQKVDLLRTARKGSFGIPCPGACISDRLHEQYMVYVYLTGTALRFSASRHNTGIWTRRGDRHPEFWMECTLSQEQGQLVYRTNSPPR